MADINQVQLPDGSQYNIKDSNSGYATQSYVQDQISGITKSTIGLGNVDNTSDMNKPVSTAQQTALNGKTNTSVIAYTESSATATKRYEIGDKFILNGVLYTATAIIANGGTITVGTNCTASDDVITQISELGIDVKRIKNRKVVIIADSYGMVHDVTFLSILKESAPNVYDGAGVSSIGFLPVSPYTFSDQFDSFISGYTSVEKEAVTDIVFCGGWNDARELYQGGKTISDLKSAILTTTAHVLSVCPNANVKTCFMAWHSARSTQNQVSLDTLLDVMNTYEGAIGDHLSSLTDCKYAMRDIFCMDSSLFHPNETKGAPAIAKLLHCNLFGGSAHYNTKYTFLTSYFDTNPFVVPGNFDLHISLEDDKTYLKSSMLLLNNASFTGGIIGVINKQYTPIVMPSTSGDGTYIMTMVYVKGTINGVNYTNMMPVVLYIYATSGNMLLTTPDGNLVTSVSNAYLKFDSVINNQSLT